MKRFSLNYIKDKNFFNFIKKNLSEIESIRYQIDNGFLNYNLSELKTLLIFGNNNKIKIILDFLDNCEGKMTGNKKYFLFLIKLLEKLKNDYNLYGITLTNLLYVKLIKQHLPKLKIYSGVNSLVFNSKKALMIKQLDIDGFVLNSGINRELKIINDIQNKTELPNYIVLNPGCIKFCPFDRIHNNIISHKVENKSNLINSYACRYLAEENKKIMFLIPFILPGDLYRYSDFNLKFIINGNDLNHLEIILNAYLKEKYDGNINDLLEKNILSSSLIKVSNNFLEEKEFFEKIQNCNGDCDKCNICNEFIC